MREKAAHRHSSPEVESAEQGLASDAANNSRSEKKRNPPRRRRRSHRIMGFGPIPRARLRRFMLSLKRDPRFFWLSVCVATVSVIFLGSWLLLFARYARLDVTVTSKRLLSPHTVATINHSVLNSDTFQSTPGVQISIKPIIFPGNDHFNADLGLSRDYGDLEFDLFEDDEARRHIKKDFTLNQSDYRDLDEKTDDDMDAYYFFDDDYLRGRHTAYDDEDKINEDKNCRYVAEHRYNFQNCNEFHQLDRSDPMSRFRYLNEGSYREVFFMVHSYGGNMELFAIKDIAYDQDMSYDSYEFVRMDAIVAERLTASPRIYDIYGFCGFGILSELFYHGDIEKDVIGGDECYMLQRDLHDQDEVKPQNNLTGIEKLVLALEMAEALADLHGYAHGLIIHDDIQLNQYLFNTDKTKLKLNDFNRAEFPLFDEKNNEYCRYKNGKGGGNWRAPEEYKDLALTEKIDVWSLGNNMYTLLTGLCPDYEIQRVRIFIAQLLSGKLAYIDPRYRDRSPAEAKLVDLIHQCFQWDPATRPSIFEVVSYLRDAANDNLETGVTREQVLRGIKTSY